MYPALREFSRASTAQQQVRPASRSCKRTLAQSQSNAAVASIPTFSITRRSSSKVVKSLPVHQQRIIRVDKKRVIKLLTQLCFERPKTGKVHHKTAVIQRRCREPEREAAAVSVDETTMARVSPLSMRAGIALERLRAAEAGGGREHDGWEQVERTTAAGSRSKPLKQRPDAAPQSRLHRPTPF